MPIRPCSPAITSNTEMPARKAGAVGVAREAHQPGHGLDDQVVAGQPGALGGAEPADREVDEPGVAAAAVS